MMRPTNGKNGHKTLYLFPVWLRYYAEEIVIRLSLVGRMCLRNLLFWTLWLTTMSYMKLQRVMVLK